VGPEPPLLAPRFDPFQCHQHQAPAAGQRQQSSGLARACCLACCHTAASVSKRHAHHDECKHSSGKGARGAMGTPGAQHT